MGRGGAATALLFLKGRISFLDEEGVPAKANAGAPSVLVAYGEYDATALKQSNIPGAYVRLENSRGVS